MSVTCSTCGEQWPRDPALEVPCPICHAPVGVKCRRPSGHPCEIHIPRDQAALDAGKLHKCSGKPPIAGQADPEYQSRLDAQRVTAEFATHSARPLDAGKQPITDSPLFGGAAQGNLFS